MSAGACILILFGAGLLASAFGTIVAIRAGKAIDPDLPGDL